VGPFICVLVNLLLVPGLCVLADLQWAPGLCVLEALFVVQDPFALFYAIVLPDRRSSFQAGFRPDFSQY
jgi:hypothetical protein